MRVLDLCVAWRIKRAERLEAQKVVEALELEEKELKAKALEAIKKSPTKAVSDGSRLFQLVTKDEPVAEDWLKIQKYIQKTGEFDLLQRRLATAAVKERWENGVKIPGIGVIPVDNLSDTKAK